MDKDTHTAIKLLREATLEWRFGRMNDEQFLESFEILYSSYLFDSPNVLKGDESIKKILDLVEEEGISKRINEKMEELKEIHGLKELNEKAIEFTRKSKKSKAKILHKKKIKGKH